MNIVPCSSIFARSIFLSSLLIEPLFSLFCELSFPLLLLFPDPSKFSVISFPNISITDGKVYNGNSLERADSKEYTFLRTNEGIYINLKEIKIKTTANEYIVPANSLIAFEENEVRYYSVRNSILVFNEIKDIDNNSQIVIKNIDTGVQNAQNSLNAKSCKET